MIGNQPAISGHGNSKLVISTGWLAGHEVQFKDTTENQEKKNKSLYVGLLNKKCSLQNNSQLTER